MDIAALTTDRFSHKTEAIDIDGVGSITVRAISRYEFALLQKINTDENPELWEQTILSFAMVDPKMTKKDVEAWQKASPLGEINNVAKVVNRLSGIGEGADKSGV